MRRSAFQAQIRGRIWTGLKAGLIYLNGAGVSMKYWNIMAAPTIGYSIPADVASTIDVNLGIGLNFRRISHSLTVTDESGMSLSKQPFHQDDFGPSLQFGLSADANISESIYITPGSAFDFIYDRHPDQGDFGNTGGFCFTFGAGLSF